MSFVVKPKQRKSIAMQAFPEQFKSLRPENTKAGGVKSRSQPMEVRMAVYRAIADMFKVANPLCKVCQLKGNVPPRYTDDVHHSRGRDGLLLFDVRYFVAACRQCHCYLHDNPEEAKKLISML